MADEKVIAEDHSRKGYTEDILNIAFAPLTNFILTLDSIPGDELADKNLNARRTAETLQALFDHGHSSAMNEYAKERSAGPMDIYKSQHVISAACEEESHAQL